MIAGYTLRPRSLPILAFTVSAFGSDLRSLSTFTRRVNTAINLSHSSRATGLVSQTSRTPFKMSDDSVADAIRLFRDAFPDVNDGHHKGQAGRVAVIGGSSDYTGAPFFASISAFRAGAELVYIFAHPEAAPVLKTYSPDLIVQTVSKYSTLRSNEFLDRVNAIIVGPGLGREPDAANAVLSAIDRSDVCVILDADALWHAAQDSNCNSKLLDACRNRKAPIVLTPNVVELDRLNKSFGLDENATAMDVAKKLGPAAVVVAKGRVDVVASQNHSVQVDWDSSIKRVGGQGDILAGVSAVTSIWAIMARDAKHLEDTNADIVSALVTASVITRESAKRACQVHRRALLASDIISYIGPVVDDLERNNIVE